MPQSATHERIAAKMGDRFRRLEEVDARLDGGEERIRVA